MDLHQSTRISFQREIGGASQDFNGPALQNIRFDNDERPIPFVMPIWTTDPESHSPPLGFFGFQLFRPRHHHCSKPYSSPLFNTTITQPKPSCSSIRARHGPCCMTLCQPFISKSCWSSGHWVAAICGSQMLPPTASVCFTVGKRLLREIHHLTFHFALAQQRLVKPQFSPCGHYFYYSSGSLANPDDNRDMDMDIYADKCSYHYNEADHSPGEQRATISFSHS